MEKKDLHVEFGTTECLEEALPPVLKLVSSQTVAGFDCVGYDKHEALVEPGTEVADTRLQDKEICLPELRSPIQMADHSRSFSLSFSLPSSPSGLHIAQTKMVIYTDKDEADAANGKWSRPLGSEFVSCQQPQQVKFHSQPMPMTEGPRRVPRSDSARDKRFDPFKTWSGRLERQLSNLRGKPHGEEEEEEEEEEEDLEANYSHDVAHTDAVPAVERYFDALEGPELDTLRETEVSVLPEDKKWPFLLRFPINAFGMCLGVSSQAILWKTLAKSRSMTFLHVSPTPNLVLWWISLALIALISFIYSLKVIFYFEAVRREYYHPVRVNFFFAPWIACLFLALAVPPSVAVKLHPSLWYVLMAPIFCLELKIYGQWMSGGERRLSKVANSSNHLSIVGNFVGALLGATMRLKEGPVFFFAVGLAHYIVLFVTLYQRLPTNLTLPKELHPVFFLFVAAPSVASMAWAKIQGEFDYGARIAYYIALFLYMSLAVRINFFRGFRFSLSWWAYTFPMTGAAIASIRHSEVVTNLVTQSLAIGLSAISTFTVTALLVTTIIHAFVLGNLFPNDISIAITQKRPKFCKMLAHLRSSSSDVKYSDSSARRVSQEF